MADRLSEPQIVAIKQTLWDHAVLFFRDQEGLDDASQLRFTEQLGPLEPTMKSPIFAIRTDEETPQYADEWHSDMTYAVRPPAIGVLRAVHLPPYGGDTMWASLHAAYETMSSPLRAFADRLEVEHGPTENFLRSLRAQGKDDLAEKESHRTSVLHPLVRTHPESGRQSLFLCPRYTIRIAGLTDDESKHILHLMNGLLDNPNIQLRWRWRMGDVVVWDQRSTVHRALSDHFPQTRILMRTTVAGEVPRFHRIRPMQSSAAGL